MSRRLALASALGAVVLLARVPIGLASVSGAHAKPAAPTSTFDLAHALAPAWMSPRFHGSTTFVFPKETDPRHLQDDPWMWHQGDWLEGTRQTSLPSVTMLSGTLKVENSIEDCGYYKIDVLLNQRNVGTVTLAAHAESMQIDLVFPRVQGPTYTLRYSGAEQVASGCGSVKIVYDVTDVTLR